MKYLFFVLALLPFQIRCQNLIPNGSFEDTVSCPTVPSLFFVQNWINPTQGTPDYFNYCSNYAVPGFYGYQAPHTGDAYSGIIIGSPTTNAREYMEVPLSIPLTAGNCYRFSFYANAAHQKYTTDAIHAYISDSLVIGVQTNDVLPFGPQISNSSGNFLDTLNWTLIEDEFVATGLEEYIIIGNFKDKSLCNWIIQDSSQISNCYVYIDDVTLIELTCTGISEVLSNEITVYPNPANTILHFNANLKEPVELTIYDALMKQCIIQKFVSELTIDISQLNQGSYYYTLQSVNKILKSGVFIK